MAEFVPSAHNVSAFAGMRGHQAAVSTSAAFIAAFLLVGGAQAGSLASAQDAPASASREPAPRTASEVTVIPFELADNLVRISVEVNGQRRSGVLDSGAGAVLIDRRVSRELGLGENGSAGDAAGGGNEAKKLLPVTIARLSAGPFRFEDLVAYAVDLSNLSFSAGFPIDVLLGAPAFQNGTVSVDYARRQVTVDRSGATVACASPIPLEIVHEAPIIAIDVRPTAGERPVRLKVLVDLGTRHNALVLGGAFVRSEAGKRLLGKAVAKEIGYGVGGAVKGTVVRIADVRAGAASFGSLETGLTSDVPAFEGTGIDGTLGVPLWNGGVIAFDYAGRRLCITRPAATGRSPSTNADERRGHAHPR
ncbi:retropepsin-like aspartic protease [Sphingomonas lycopersici]|uniref:Retroviral-like aspartic protease family protein n=1 Tax=Sphingomonas lycopersici TaxID=2951807 RepID=A0AA41ZHS0_9SPHN|nr:retropepsin-like aspartic protease [Sphingomonas lycopersici]MCW6536891.1 retroviral-like aspartic protease family protein [Sphingomonas lycopersici]